MNILTSTKINYWALFKNIALDVKDHVKILTIKTSDEAPYW